MASRKYCIVGNVKIQGRIIQNNIYTFYQLTLI